MSPIVTVLIAGAAFAQEAPANPQRRPVVIRPAPAAVLQFGIPGSQPLGPGQGMRSVTATVKGQRITIDDRYGLKIEMSITRKENGEERTEKFSAADVAALRSAHPDAAALYQKLTGTH